MVTKSQRAVVAFACVGALCAPSTHSFKICQGDKPVFDTGLCYPSCPENTYGIGPVCYQHCPESFRDDGLFCKKPTFTRSLLSGIPLTPKCDSDQDLDGLLCYPKCSSAYVGVGPVCWEKCPSNLRDDGAFCGKVSYGRGVGTIPPMRCNSNEELDGALCYPKCNSGYYGVGPVCWAYCSSGYTDHGASCYKNLFDWYFKSSYGRGFGRVPDYRCNSNQDKDAGLCYRKCNSGYYGVGPVCWTSCPSTMTDIGVSCAKRSYGRTAGTVPKYVCAGSNEARADAACLEWCKSGYSEIGIECQKNCPSDMVDIGISCTKNTHGRGVGVIPPSCTSASFTNPYTVPESSESFASIVMNDPQLVWWQRGGCEDEGAACRQALAETEAENQVYAMNRVSTLRRDGIALREPNSVVINGDLTSFFHVHEYALFNKYYSPAANSRKKEFIKYPIMPGLGNHDYQNNIDGTFPSEPDYLIGPHGAAKKARDFIRGVVSCDVLSNFPTEKLESFDHDSLAYSWNEGKYHFVQLHNYPFYVVPSLDIKSSIDWFEKDIKAATARGQPIVINVHQSHQFNVTIWEIEDKNITKDEMEEIIASRKTKFEALLESNNVVAIFAGHYIGFESSLGYQNTLAGVPVFRGGHAGQDAYGKFLHVDFNENSIQVSTIDSVPPFGLFREGEDKYHFTVEFNLTSTL